MTTRRRGGRGGGGNESTSFITDTNGCRRSIIVYHVGRFHSLVVIVSAKGIHPCLHDYLNIVAVVTWVEVERPWCLEENIPHAIQRRRHENQPCWRTTREERTSEDQIRLLIVSTSYSEIEFYYYLVSYVHTVHIHSNICTWAIDRNHISYR